MKYLVYPFFLLIHVCSVAQDVHFSQFYNALLNVNPASTGVGATPVRLGLLYRNQWTNIGTPYRTFTGFIDGRLSVKKLYRTWFGAGLAAYNDRAGDGVLSNTSVSLGFSVTQGFTYNNTLLLSMGFSLGLINRSVQFSNLVFDEQWNGVKFDPAQANNETFVSQSVISPDLDFGINISYALNQNLKLEAGMALHHINKPKSSFYDADNRIDRKLLSHARVEITTKGQSIITFAAFYSVQAKTEEIIYGGNLAYPVSDIMLFGGLWYRWGRDVIPAVGMELKQYRFSISYDVNISVLHPASNYQGGVELSLIKLFIKKSSRYPCSEFR